MKYPWDYDCFSKEPEAVAWRKKFEEHAKRGMLFTLWPGNSAWTFDSGSEAIAKALSEAKRVKSYVPIYQLSSECPELVAFEIGVATPDGIIERKP